jgi:hypothetical protein
MSDVPYPIEIAYFAEYSFTDEYGQNRRIYSISMETREAPYWVAVHEPDSDVPFRLDVFNLGEEKPISEERITIFLTYLPQIGDTNSV